MLVIDHGLLEVVVNTVRELLTPFWNDGNYTHLFSLSLSSLLLSLFSKNSSMLQSTIK
jgi:hypothetical protein